ncbi:TBC domain protein [Gregarina niphandrodes]|uniref:TBC domain protein n=1 Tax=Gregarina niphandrodes TaxID=110365 RepID=A0A023BA37_GRENI|nr:TBC domain protein [Gregarina niphandrodes]EZG77687.1 TBC domain protein [Gregarina niphandrodes]|eukprot:XP_011129486.1 TBC domain protein [Gregarina niphandrodes]
MDDRECRLLDAELNKEGGYNMDKVREIASTGLPLSITWLQRAKIWKLLVGITTPNTNDATLEKMRSKYRTLAANKFNGSVEFSSSDAPLTPTTPSSPDMPLSPLHYRKSEEGTGVIEQRFDLSQLRQIRLDLVRTRPDRFSRFFGGRKAQFVLTRLLYVWGVTNPACGYVQGINDIAVPFFIVYALGELQKRTGDHLSTNFDHINEILVDDDYLTAECDTFLTLQIILNEVQDNYIAGRPGVNEYIRTLNKMLSRVHPALHGHLKEIGVAEEQFALRWVNCIFAREFSSLTLIRLWDGILSEEIRNLKSTLIYISVTLLMKFGDRILQYDFEKSMLLLQRLPTLEWTPEEIPTLLAEAYVWRCLFAESPQHLR